MAEKRSARICIIGSGAAGLITAYTLVQDGFEHVEILTRDTSPGGVWAAQRVYPGLTINNVHGEFRFPPLVMPPPNNARTTGGRLSGDDMKMYMENFAGLFLKGMIRSQTEVIRLRRHQVSGSSSKESSPWTLTVRDLRDESVSDLVYDKVVLCTGGCSNPSIPETLSPEAGRQLGFHGPIIHSSNFSSGIPSILEASKSKEDVVVVIGGGKSAQDAAAYLANEGKYGLYSVP